MKRQSGIKMLLCAVLALSLAAAATAVPAAAAGADALSDRGVQFIEDLEGYSQYAKESGGKWYIGYGVSCGENDYPNGVTREEAETLLRARAADYETALNSFFSGKGIALSQSRYDALVSFTYNLGTQWMSSSNRIYAYLANGIENYTDLEIVNAIGTWCHVGGAVSDNLVGRRMAEAKLFLYGDYGDGSSPDFCYLALNTDGGTTEHSIVFYEKGAPYGTLPGAAKANVVFDGWYTSGGARLAAEDAVTKNLSVTARWRAWTNTYPDVAESDWYYKYVAGLSAAGVVKGYDDGSFRPGGTVTCGEALDLILLATGSGVQTAESGRHWASGYLAYAVGKGYLDAGEVSNLDAPMSRLLIAKVAARAMGLEKADVLSPFADTADGYVLALYEAGIVTGSTGLDGKLAFLPDDGIKRSEVSAIIWRIDNPEAHETQLQYGDNWLPILQNVPAYSLDNAAFSLADGRMSYSGAGVRTETGVDVSSWQGKIDWEKVAADGIDFAMVRLGFRGYTTGKICLDDYFDANMAGAAKAGLSTGIYFYSQAITVDEALEEADYVISHLKGYDVACPVVFDWEIVGGSAARTYGQTQKTVTECAAAFCGRIREAGYTPMIYFNRYLGYMKYDLGWLTDCGLWYAGYESTPDFHYDFDIWQYSDTGTVDGITTGGVDLDLRFIRK